MISTYAINTIEIIETAIRENISVSESCTLIGKNKNYVNDFFRRCPKMVSKSEFNHIKNLYEKYKISYSENSKQENTSSKPSKENLSQNNNTNASKRYQLKTNASSYDLNNTDFMLDVDTDEINKNSKLYKKDEFDLNNISFSSEEENTDLLYDPFSDKNYDEKRSYGESVRNNNGRITHYKYKIVIKGEPELNGEFTREEMDRVYRLYSNIEGAGLSIRTVSREFKNLTFRDFKRIIRVFNITKSSVPVAPHIIEENSTDEVANLILRNKENNILKALENDRSRFFERSLVGAYKTISDLKSNEVWIEDVVKKYIDKPETPSTNKRIKLQKDKKQNKDLGSPAFIMFSDIHFGKSFDRTTYGRGSSKEILHERIMQIADYTIEDYKQRNPSEIILISGGDVIETAMSDGMHPGHLYEMDLFMEEQIFFACDSIKEMILKIKENTSCPISINFCSGNHERVAMLRTEDKNRTAGKIISHILKRELESQNIKFNIPSNNLIKIISGNLCMFVQHGDTSLHKKRPTELINLYGERGKYNVLLKGHWHQLKAEEGTNYLSIALPSVCSTDAFVMEELGNNALPGFIIGHESSSGIGFDYKKITLY